MRSHGLFGERRTPRCRSGGHRRSSGTFVFAQTIAPARRSSARRRHPASATCPASSGIAGGRGKIERLVAVLDRHRQTVQWPARVASGTRVVGRSRFGTGPLHVHRDHGVDRRVHPFDVGEHRVEQFDARHLPPFERDQELHRGRGRQVGCRHQAIVLSRPSAPASASRGSMLALCRDVRWRMLADQRIDAVLFDFAGVITGDPFASMIGYAIACGHRARRFREDRRRPRRLRRRGPSVAPARTRRDRPRRVRRTQRNSSRDRSATTSFPPLPTDSILGGALEVRPEMLELIDELRRSRCPHCDRHEQRQGARGVARPGRLGRARRRRDRFV